MGLLSVARIIAKGSMAIIVSDQSREIGECHAPGSCLLSVIDDITLVSEYISLITKLWS